MSLQAAAQHMASQGRGPDTTLVHMSPKEVRSLQELAMAHGGSLTINPQTGLPEAGFLSSILPMIAGFALGPAGFALMSAPMAGLAVGGLQALRTKSIGKGIMAGLGAYGGAGLGEAFAQTGAQAAARVPEAASQLSSLTATSTPDQIFAAQQAAQQAAQSVSAAQSAPFMDRLGDVGKGIQGLGSEAGRSAFMQNIGGAKGLLQTGGALAAPLVGSLFEPKTKTPPPVDREQMQFAFDPGRLETPAQVGGIGEYTYFRPSYTRLNPTTKMAAEGGTMTSDYTYDPETQLYSREKTPPQQDRASSGNAGPYTISVSDPTPNGFQDLTPAQQAAFFAANPAFSPISQLGQQVVSKTSLGMAQAATNPNIASRAASIAQAINPDIADPSVESAGLNPGNDGPSANDGGAGPGPGAGYAVGGISHLGDYSDGGRLLRGPGDGVSDSIPATIANKRPARLADGEFVVPARIVSELGNGSTEAGARKLYAMMDRIQKNRNKSVGKGKVAVNSRSEKLLPA